MKKDPIPMHISEFEIEQMHPEIAQAIKDNSENFIIIKKPKKPGTKKANLNPALKLRDVLKDEFSVSEVKSYYLNVFNEKQYLVMFLRYLNEEVKYFNDKLTIEQLQIIGRNDFNDRKFICHRRYHPPKYPTEMIGFKHIPHSKN